MAPTIPKPPSSASSIDSSHDSPASPTVVTTGASRNPPLSPSRPIFLGNARHSDEQDDSAPSTPQPGQHNPFGTPGGSLMGAGDLTPSLSPSSRVQSTGSGFGYFPGGDITSRASGILSVHGRTPSASNGANPFSSGRSNISGLSSNDGISEMARPNLNTRSSSAIREAFQSPPARSMTFTGSRVGSTVNVNGEKTPRAPAKRLKSTMLTGEIDKPWTKKKDTIGRLAYWLTYGVAFLGIVGSALRCYFGYMSVPKFKHPLCPILDDNFDNGLDKTIWEQEVRMDGFGNGQFEMTTDSSNNSFVKDGKLYIMPTLTADVIGESAVFDNHVFNISGCTGANYTECSAVSNMTTNQVIPPVMSARLTTRLSRSMRFGRVEIRAKIPRGDWIWPALWMLPKDNVYGQWPLSGEIDIMEARGNGPEYSKQGRNYVRGSLNWGPTSWLNAVHKTYGWWNMRRSGYDQDFHTYALEWTEDWMRIYVDTRLHHMIDMRFNKPFWARGDFPAIIQNGSNTIALSDPWALNATVPNAAPFDQQFYLIMNVAVGGTNGWFPDNAGDKPWIDNSKQAMSDFAKNQQTWYNTWPQGDKIDDRAMIIDSVKMWSQC